jgi:hypothetical protein
MARALIRLGGLLCVASVVYLAAAQILAGAPDKGLFWNIVIAGALCLALGLVLSMAGRGMAVLVGRSCPRCGHRVGRGRVYCDEHLQETINEYRDQQRNRGA